MREDKKPLISVLMGVHYRRTDLYLLKRSVESVLNQTCSDFELLICDGGSSKEACGLLDSLAFEDSRIRLIRDKDIRTDLASKLNVCLRYAAGQWIARMDDDDFSYPERFARQVNYLNNHPDVAFVGCNVALHVAGERVGSRNFPERPQVKDFYFTQPFIHPTLMFRKEVLVAIGGYSENKHQVLCEDYDLLLRLYTVGHCGMNLQEILFDYTVSASAKGNRNMKHRWNETVTRYFRFRDLKVLPKALPYVVKPLMVGLLPESTLMRIKEKQQCRT